MTIQPGDRVKHPTLHEQWGPGEVLSVQPDGKMVIHFALAGQKTIKGIALERLEGAEADHPMLRNRIRDRKTRRRTIPIDFSRDAFLRLFPGGFDDPHYLETERNYKVAASHKLAELLGRSQIASLLKKGDYEAVCRAALAVINATNLVFPNEKMDLKDGLKTSEAMQSFAEALDDLLYGGGSMEGRFVAFADVLARIGAPKWTIATYFLFLAFPDEHMFLKPVVTQAAAEACGFELNYSSDLNWLTYESLLRFATSLKSVIADLKPRDMIDLQSFIWCIGERV